MNITPIPINDNEIPVTYGIYLHGVLEQKNGFDMVNIDELPKKDGIYDCVVTIKDVQYASKLFYWKVAGIKARSVMDRGYIVAVDDTTHITDAQKKYKRRADCI